MHGEVWTNRMCNDRTVITEVPGVCLCVEKMAFKSGEADVAIINPADRRTSSYFWLLCCL